VIEFFQYPLALLVTLGVLVTVHELGHFLIARWSGVRVVRFSIGFGRPIWKRTDRRGTEFVIALIPLGGFVRMLDEREPGVIEVARRPGDVSYADLSVWWRIAIAAGGPFANFVLAVIVYWVLYVLGTTAIAPILGPLGADTALGRAGVTEGTEIVSIDGEPTRSWQEVAMALAGRLGDTGAIVFGTREPGAEARVTEHAVPIVSWHRGVDEPDLLGSLGIEPALPAIMGEVLGDGPAARAGFERWDRVIAVDGTPVEGWAHWVRLVQAAPDKALSVRILRDGREQTLSVRPEARPGPDGATSGYVGVAPYVHEVRYGPVDAIPRSLSETGAKTVMTLDLLRKMVLGDVSVKNLSGPITIARVAGDSVRSGLPFFLGILALLSISLAVLNLLPIPILDGGHILFCLAEVVRGKPLPERVQALGMQIGLFVVGGLMILALYNDVARLF
jgi:regulator of sigma E protease